MARVSPPELGGGSDVGAKVEYGTFLSGDHLVVAFYTFLVMILAGPVHQESIVEPLKGRFSYSTVDVKSIRYRRG